MTVGLPDVPGVFTASESTPQETPQELVAGRGTLKIGYGEEGEGFYCVDRESGAVLYVESYERSGFFVNSSPQTFAKCLELFQEETSRLTVELDPSEFEEAAASLGRGIEEIDSPAMSEDPGFWRSLLFDVAIGDYCGDSESE